MGSGAAPAVTKMQVGCPDLQARLAFVSTLLVALRRQCQYGPGSWLEVKQPGRPVSTTQGMAAVWLAEHCIRTGCALTPPLCCAGCAVRTGRCLAAPPAAPGGSLGLYEDTEFIGDAGRPGSLGSGSGGAEGGDFEVYADTEFLTKPVAAAAAADHRGGSGATCSSSGGNTSSCSKENAAGSAEDGSSSWQHHHHQQQVRQDDLRVQGSSGRPRGLAPHPVSPRAAVGMCGSGSSILQQQHSLGYGGAGPSRFGPGSVPNSPGRLA